MVSRASPTAVPEPAPPKPPRSATNPSVGLDPDLDPEFPDIDGAALVDTELSFPMANTITVLRSHLTGGGIAPDTDAALDAVDTTFVEVDLTGRRIESFDRVVFTRCRLGGTDGGDARIRDVRFDDCVLDLASFRAATFERVEIVGGRMAEVDLSRASFADVRISGVDLSDTTLDGARLERVDLTEAVLDGVVDVTALRGATIGDVQAIALAARLARAAGIAVAPRDPPT